MYIVKKDGLYLMGYMNMGITEYDSRGAYRSVYTGVYSSNRRDAMPVENRTIAEMLGDEVMRIREVEKR